MKNKQLLYTKALLRVLRERMEDLEDRNLLKQNVFYGVRDFNLNEDVRDPNQLADDFKFASILKQTMSGLTPREFMNLFPVTKIYDGEKFGMKDYYSTMEYVNTLDQDKPIGDNITVLIMEYLNKDIIRFAVNFMTLSNKIRRSEGYLDVFEEFMASEGHDTPNTFEDGKGNVMYVRQGKPEIIKGSKPSYLNLVK